MRDQLLEFELRLNVETSERVVEHAWGRAFLSPSLPLVWDANWALVEQPGMTVEEVIAAAEESMADCAHRAIAIRDEGEGARLAEEIREVSGWEAETDLYMAWDEDRGIEPGSEVHEASIADCADLRRELIRSGFPIEMENRDETAEQLLEMNRRFARAGGDRWFVAPPEQPASACCLLAADGIGQVEDVGTLPPARGAGLAKSVVLQALAASRAAGHHVTFLVAEADDWPRLMYEKLGFRTRGRLHVLRRAPTTRTTA